MQALPVAAHDQQCVVDPDADSQHRGRRRRPHRHGDDPRHHSDQRHPAADAKQRRHDRQPHRQQRPERDQQDDHRREDADRFAGRHRLLREHVAAEFNLHARHVQVGAQLLHGVARVDVLLPAAIGEVDRRVRDLAVRRHLPRALRRVRAGDGGVACDLRDLGEERFHRLLHRRVVDTLVRLEHDLGLDSRAGAEAAAVENVLGLLRFRTR